MKYLIIGLLLISLICTACGQNAVLDNDKYGYSIEYPENWELELNAISTPDIHADYIWAPRPYKGMVSITVYNNYSNLISEAASAVVDQCRADYKDVIVIQNGKNCIDWDWCLTIDYQDPGSGYFRDFYYYKKKGNQLYEIQTTSSKDDYDALALDRLVATFRLK